MGATANFKILKPDELIRIVVDPDSIEEVLFPEEMDNPFEGQFDLDKVWHCIHYILVGSSKPDGSVLGDAILGGTEVGPDLGYGRARLVSHDRVKEIAMALSVVDFGAACATTDLSSPLLSEVYGGRHLAQEREYLEPFFHNLVAAYSRASEEGRSILAYLA